MLGDAACDPLTPKPKRTRFHLSAHELDGLRLAQAKGCFDDLKGRTVLPRHFNDAGHLRFGQSVLGDWHGVMLRL